MPSANECELSRVYVRNTGGLVGEESIKDNVNFEVVLEAEAGQTLHNGGGPYKLILVVTDFTNDYITYDTQTKAGTFGDATWPNLPVQFAFTVPATGAGRDDHVFQAIGVVTAGLADPIVDTEFSDVFIITPP
jgi:hypothetical protein